MIAGHVGLPDLADCSVRALDVAVVWKEESSESRD
jgi:hypothetical protein